MSVLCTADLAVTDFLRVIKEHSFPDSAFLMAFSPATAMFGHFQLDEDFLSQTFQGRIFSPESELKWRRIDGLLRAVYLGKGPALNSFENNESELKDLTPQITKPKFFLWGRYYDPTQEWIEQQVPHRFRYPIIGNRHTNGRVSLLTEVWTDFAGMARFERYYSVQETPGE